MSEHYILDGETVVPCDLLTWAEWMAHARDKRIVKKTDVGGGAEVSTVFLGLDHRFGDTGPPMLFETLVFGGPHDGSMERCSTWEQAEAQHTAMIERIKS